MKPIVFLVLLSISFCANAYGFDSFNNESSRVTKEINCAKPKINSASGSWGALYSCIGGIGQTVKFFINEKPKTGQVRNIKFLWNDWTKEIGQGIHTDSKIAKSWVSSLATMFAPKQAKEITNTFFGKVNKTIESEHYLLKFTYHVGPAIDERMYIITKK